MTTYTGFPNNSTGSSGLTVSSGAEFDVNSGGLIISTTVDSGGTVKILDSTGVASATTVLNGGSISLTAGSATATIVNSGATETIYGGVGSGETILGSQTLYNSGATASGDTVTGTGIETLGGGAVAFSTIVTGGGVQQINGGGIGSGTIVSNGGQVLDYTSGLLTGAMIGSGGTVSVFGGSATATTVLSSGSLTIGAGSTDSGTVVSTGGVENALAGSVDSAASIMAGGVQNVFGTAASATIAAGGVQTVQSGGLASATVISSGATQVITAGGSATLTQIIAGGALDLSYLGYGPGGSASITSGGLLTVTEGGASFVEQLAGNYSGLYFHVASGSAGGTALSVTTTPCYCRGTLIATDKGEVAVEDLRAGDRLLTASGASRPLVWVGHRSYAGRFLAGNDAALPVRIRAGALGGGLPRRDLFVSPLHAMFLDGMLIPAANLVNGISILKVTALEQVDYFHLELETHDVILAEGALSESYVDDENRAMFQNAAEFAAQHPDAAPVPAIYCAPRVEAGHALEAVRSRLNHQAGLLQAA